MEEDVKKLQDALAAVTAENKSLKGEIERLKNGNGFDADAYIKKLQEQAQRDKAATQDLVSRFL